MASMTLELEAVETFLYITRQPEKLDYVFQHSKRDGRIITVPFSVLKEIGYLKYINREE